MTIESLPPENRTTGRSNSPATSRKIGRTASDSSASRCDSANGLSVPDGTVLLTVVVTPDPSR